MIREILCNLLWFASNQKEVCVLLGDAECVSEENLNKEE